MKITVIRNLSAGVYFVGLRVGEFTEEERIKMQKFGIPTINVYVGPPSGRSATKQPLTQLSDQKLPLAGFTSEEEAKKYEASVLDQIRKAAAVLKEQRDSFTSIQEVEI